MSNSKFSTKAVTGTRVIPYLLIIAVIIIADVRHVSAQGLNVSRVVDSKIEAFALDGGTKMELIDGMEESEVIEQLKVVRSRYDAIYSYGDSKARNADKALLRMGDEETIIRLMDQYHKGEGHGESLLMAANEKALKYLIEDVRSGSEEWRRVAYDSWDLPIRYESTQTVLLIVKRNPIFPEKTRQWADRMQTLVGINGRGQSAANTVLNWWEKNEVAILEGRYAEASWLPAEVQKSGTDNQRSTKRPGDGERDRLANGVLIEDNRSSKPAQDAKRNMNVRDKVFVYVAGAIIFVFIIWLMMKNRRMRIRRK
jgi:hypothetical protein